MENYALVTITFLPQPGYFFHASKIQTWIVRVAGKDTTRPPVANLKKLFWGKIYSTPKICLDFLVKILE